MFSQATQMESQGSSPPEGVDGSLHRTLRHQRQRGEGSLHPTLRHRRRSEEMHDVEEELYLHVMQTIVFPEIISGRSNWDTKGLWLWITTEHNKEAVKFGLTFRSMGDLIAMGKKLKCCSCNLLSKQKCLCIVPVFPDSTPPTATYKFNVQPSSGLGRTWDSLGSGRKRSYGQMSDPECTSRPLSDYVATQLIELLSKKLITIRKASQAAGVYDKLIKAQNYEKVQLFLQASDQLKLQVLETHLNDLD